jgi:putative heme iron utilization protein
MDAQIQQVLVRLIRDQRTAALGTVRNGAPEVSMVLFAASQDCPAFYLHISKLAHHTQNILHDARVSLMFGLGDFGLHTIEPKAARFVAGFAQTYATRSSSTTINDSLPSLNNLG